MRYFKASLLLTLLLIAFTSANAQAQIGLQPPGEYLGYELGDQFTPHHKVLGYFKQVAEASPMVSYEAYGRTNEGRELGVVKVSTEENHANLEQIRTDNLKRTGLIEGNVQGGEVPIVWLSYNVHGNESSSSEAAMKTLYELVRPDRSDTKQWLQNTLVIMDPMMNPDGRDRYVHWYKETAGSQFNAHPEAREHREPWPGGRTNHYYFDLNRDWAWLTQKESRARLALYQEWMPQIHVDFHEQGYNDPYYFAPAAEPFHKAITDWQRQFQVTIGKNHAKYFDKNNWLYFTKEIFDLFYPSYGDTYPIFNGAIGMTYEQGGSGFAGLGIIKAEGDTLTLHDRLLHHHTTGLSTVEVTANNAQKVLDEFETYFQTAVEEPAGQYKSYVIKNDSSANLRAMLELLDQHQIEYGRLGGEEELSGFDYRTGEQEDRSFGANDIVVSAYQPKSVLARVLFDPRPELADSLTYDITAWALPYAYGLDATAIESRVDGESFNPSELAIDNNISGEPYAYLTDWEDVSDLAFLAELLKKEINLRVAQEPFTTEGRDYEAGTLVITRNSNTGIGSEFDTIVQQAAANHHQQLYGVSSGFVTSGADFGSDKVALVEAPRVALMSGAGTSSGNVGQIWHFFDKQIGYPLTMIDTDYFKSIPLYDFDVMILPSGNYSDTLDKDQLKRMKAWVRAGGKLIALQGANEMLAGKQGFALKKKEVKRDEKDSDEKSEEGEDEEEKEEAEPDGDEDKLKTYRQRQRESATEFNPGSIFKVTMDNTHPLAFGYDDEYFSLKLDADAYNYLEDGWNVGVTQEGAHQSGFTGYKAKENLENTLTFGVQEMGSGSVVYMVDNPLFRAFWYNGKLLFGNAVFMNL